MALNATKFALAFGILSMTAIGCGSKDDHNDIGSKASENDVDLVGNWQRDCSDLTWTDAKAEVGSAIDKFEFTAAQGFKRTTELHLNGKCTDGARGTIVMSGSYAALDNRDNGQRNINFTIKNYKFTPQTDGLVKVLNTIKYCGKTDWATGTEADLLDKPCIGQKIVDGTVIADLYKRENNTFYTGRQNIWLDGKNADDRPAAVDMNRGYAKK